MNPTDLWKPVLIYTCLLGLLTVGAVYLATYSGLAILVLAGAGVFLAAIGGGAAGAVDGAGAGDGFESKNEPEVIEGTGLLPSPSVDTPLRFTVLFYGLGVLLWSLVVLATLRDTLA